MYDFLLRRFWRFAPVVHLSLHIDIFVATKYLLLSRSLVDQSRLSQMHKALTYHSRYNSKSSKCLISITLIGMRLVGLAVEFLSEITLALPHTLTTAKF